MLLAALHKKWTNLYKLVGKDRVQISGTYSCCLSMSGKTGVQRH